MKKITAILLAGMLIAVTAGVGIVAAANGQTGNSGYFGSMHQWAANRMNQYGYGGCPFYQSYVNDGNNTVELEVSTIEEAITVAEAETGQDISEDNVYQMGRWWVFSYADDEGTIKQGRIDAYTGEVIEDFYAGSANQGQYQNGRGMMRGGGYGGGYCGAYYNR
ncbi:PepSY domain-containing protein [Methanolobus chelungpuianus]|uniref:PepSY domain-containing protein n=1 Tax=Methanolobus chelungpuianus TaxID=502115 RepID=UPI002115C7A5|nr:PepSY domain-containing protein [Methanolobus chelungpuianus]